MHIIYDASCLDSKKTTGIGVYTKNLFLELKSMKPNMTHGICSLNRWLKKGTIEDHLNSKVSSNLIVPHLPYPIKILHLPDHRIMSSTADIKIQTIHDLSTLEENAFSDFNFKSKFKKKFHQIFNSDSIDHFIAVSEFTKSRVLHFYPHLKNKISVVHSGSDHIMKTKTLQPKVFPWPYILNVGTLESRKNIVYLLNAFAIVAKSFKDLRLVLIGKEGFESHRILEAIQCHPYRRRIEVMNYVDENLLSSAYRHAEMFVYPSHYEGFGFPILEAMRHRCPVVCSRIPSLLEIGGEAIETFAPENFTEMAEVIERVFINSSRRFRLKSLGTQNCESFTWKKTAYQTIKIYEHAFNQKVKSGSRFEYGSNPLYLWPI